MKFFIYFSCVLFAVWFISCGSQVRVLSHGEDLPAGSASDPANCIEKRVDGKTLCVHQKTQTFQIKDLSKKAADFVFVLDVSDSMLDDLSRLGQAFSALMSHIELSDWRMFFTTADHGDYKVKGRGEAETYIASREDWRNYKGTKPYFGGFMDLEYQGKKLQQKALSASIPNYKTVFQDSLTRKPGENCLLAPYCQGPLEQPLRVLNSVIERWAEGGYDFSLKPEGDFISFIVTDEDERVEDQEHATSAKEVAETFKKLFPQKSFYSFAFLIQDEDCLARQKAHSPSAVYGKKVSELASLTHRGKNVSLCEEDYGPALRDISALLRSLIESLTLKEQPVLTEEIQVEFIKGPERADWSLEGRKLVFKPALQPGSEIKVRYFVKAK